MISHIARKEFTEIIREGRFRLAITVVLALLAMAIVISKAYYTSIQQQHADARANARNLWVSQDDKNPHSAAHYGTYAFKPKFPLSLIDPGVDKFVGISIFLEAHRRNEAAFAAAADQTGLSRFGDLSPDFILLFIIPLLIILLGYNSFSREYESGTLLLIKSQGIPGFSLAAGKWWGVFFPILLITVFLFGLGAIFLANLSEFGEFELLYLVLMMGVYLFYFAIFTNLTIIVSALAKKSGIALVSLLSIWILVCLAAPKAASNLADYWHPYPTRQDFTANLQADKEAGLDGHDPWSEAAKKLEAETLREYGVDSIHQLPFNYAGYRMQKGEEHEAQVYFKHYSLLKETYREQTGIYQASALFSPFLPTRFLSMAIARTDYRTHWNFADAAEQYRLKMVETLNMDLSDNSLYGDWNYKADKALWDTIPDFSYDPPALSDILSDNRSNLAILFVWLLGSFAGLFFVTRKL